MAYLPTDIARVVSGVLAVKTPPVSPRSHPSGGRSPDGGYGRASGVPGASRRARVGREDAGALARGLERSAQTIRTWGHPGTVGDARQSLFPESEYYDTLIAWSGPSPQSWTSKDARVWVGALLSKAGPLGHPNCLVDEAVGVKSPGPEVDRGLVLQLLCGRVLM